MSLLRFVRGPRRFRWREKLLETVVTPLDGREFRFRCASETDVWRARTLATKEAGTIEWIRTAHSRKASNSSFTNCGRSALAASSVSAKKVAACCCTARASEPWLRCARRAVYAPLYRRRRRGPRIVTAVHRNFKYAMPQEPYFRIESDTVRFCLGLSDTCPSHETDMRAAPV